MSEEQETQAVVKRLRRVEGQVAGIIRMIEQDRPCADVVTQMAAVGKAFDRASFKYLSMHMRACLLADGDGNGEEAAMTPDEMERLFLSLA